MVSSLDGYIASEDNSISWFETADVYEKGLTVTAEESTEFLKSIDCYVMGSPRMNWRWNCRDLTAGPMAMCPLSY